MFVSLGAEFSAAAWAVLFGFSLGLAYHALFVLRVLCGVSAGSALPARLSRFHFPYIRLEGGKGVGARGRLALLFVFDFLFALGGGLSFLVFLYAVHDGAFRFFLLFSAMLGMLLYFLTLGRLVFRVLGTLSYLLHVLLSYLFLAVKIPLFLLWSVLLFCLRCFFCLLLSFFVYLFAPIASRLALGASIRAGKSFVLDTTKSI